MSPSPPIPEITDDTWILTCPKCHRWRTLREVGGLRFGARSAGKRTLARCSSCGRLRFARLERARDIPHDRLAAMLEAAPED